MDDWILGFKNAKPLGQQKVLVPGDPEREMERLRREKGIPLLPAVIEDMKNLGEKFGVNL